MKCSNALTVGLLVGLGTLLVGATDCRAQPEDFSRRQVITLPPGESRAAVTISSEHLIHLIHGASGLLVDVAKADWGEPMGVGVTCPPSVIPPWARKLSASERFHLVLSGAAVLDCETGLVWEHSPTRTEHTWALATHLAAGKAVGDRGGWRLPTADELGTLFESLPGTPTVAALVQDHPFDLPALPAAFWTTTMESEVEHCWALGPPQCGVHTWVQRVNIRQDRLAQVTTQFRTRQDPGGDKAYSWLVRGRMTR